MNANPENSSAVTIRPPQLIQSLIGGFNAVANNIHLILPPVLLDLMLWFGPHLRLKALLSPVVQEMFANMPRTTADARVMMESLEQAYLTGLEHFNLFSLLSTYPIGLPAMMAGQRPLETPLGQARTVEVGTFAGLLFGWLGFWLLGLVLGSLYLSALARCCAQPQPKANDDTPAVYRVPPLRPDVLGWQTMQMVGLVILLVIVILIILVPAVLLSSFLALISLGLAQIALILISVSAMWFLVPALFAPHGIFAAGQNLFRAILTSTRVVRYSLPGVGMFLLSALVLYQGLGLLWRTAPASSWMALVGIFGHAFVATGLIGASFIYYRSGLEYVQALKKKFY